MGRPRSAWRGLETRLFLWISGAVVIAIVASWVTTEVFRPPPQDRSHSFTRIVTAHLADIWSDPGAVDAYLASIEPTLGMEVRQIRDRNVTPTPPGPRWRMTPFGSEHHGPVILAIDKGGAQLGAISFEPPYQPQPISRFFLVPLVYMTILSIAGWVVARRLSKPLVDVAVAAERFGSGDLNARAGLSTGTTQERWVAAEIEELAITFDQMADRISGVVRDQRELLAAISHELRSPLGRARVALEIARDKTEGAASDETGTRPDESSLGPTLQRIETELGEVDTILGDLLAAARAGLSDLRKSKVELAPWLRTRIAAERTPPEVELVVEAEMAAEIDLALLGRAVHNLLQNARTHGHPRDQTLLVTLGESDKADRKGHARITVRDRGPGFAPELLDRAFEPFVRGDQARTPKGSISSTPVAGSNLEVGGNTGLGLALVRRIAEAHGGIAFARNVGAENGGGAEVVMDLPATLLRRISEPAPVSMVA
jgi:two-component system OmpR family sensor kinase